SMVELMHAILKDDVPELGELDARIPPSLDKLMRRCLEKKPDHRFHSAHDLGFALDAVASPTSSSGSGLTVAASTLREETSGYNWVGRAGWLAASVFLISTLILAYMYSRREIPRNQTM